MKKTMLAVAFAAVTITAPVSVNAKEKPPELSQTELQAVQTHTYAASRAVVFSSAIAALQTAGYLNIEANRDAGTISGQTEAKSKLMFNIFWGLGKKKRTLTAQFLVEELQPGQTTLRLNLFLNTSKTRNIIWGNKATDGELIKQGQPYIDLFKTVDDEVAKRTPVAAPAPAAVNASDPAASMPDPEPAAAEAQEQTPQH